MHKQLSRGFNVALLAAALVVVTVALSSAQSGHVVEVILKPDHPTYSGPCPMTIHFSGYVKTDGPVDVKYVFTRNDGATMEPLVLSFSRAGVQRVETTWTLGDARTLPRYAGWQAIKVLSPNPLESNHAAGAFRLVCGKPNGQPPPSSQPLNTQPPGNGHAEGVKSSSSKAGAALAQQAAARAPLAMTRRQAE